MKLTDLASWLFVLEQSEDVYLGFDAVTEWLDRLGYTDPRYTLIPLTLGDLSPREPIVLASRQSTPHSDARQHTSLHEACLRTHDLHWTEIGFDAQRATRVYLAVTAATPEHAVAPAYRNGLIRIDIAPDDRHRLSRLCVSTRGERRQILERCKQDLYRLTLIARLFHSFVLRHPRRRARFYRPVTDQLTLADQQLLRLVVAGVRLKQSKDFCGISEARAGNILSALYKRFEVTDKGQLGYLIGAHGLTDILAVESAADGGTEHAQSRLSAEPFPL